MTNFKARKLRQVAILKSNLAVAEASLKLNSEGDEISYREPQDFWSLG
jgi:hypothetical protein